MQGRRGIAIKNTYDSVEFGTFVTLRSSLSILRFSRTELAEIFCSARGGVWKELDFDAAQRLAFAVVSFKVGIEE